MLLPPGIVGYVHHERRENDPILNHGLERDERYRISESPVPAIQDDQYIQVGLRIIVSACLRAEQHHTHYPVTILLV
jgi:hypothetical protein